MEGEVNGEQARQWKNKIMERRQDNERRREWRAGNTMDVTTPYSTGNCVNQCSNYWPQTSLKLNLS